MTGLRPCEKSELPDGFTDGWHYTAPLATMPVYLDYLQARFEQAGGTLEVSPVRSLGELAGAAPVVVNCSGAAAHDLVPDPAVVPVRGQVVIAANPGIEEFLIDRDPEPPWIVYMFPHGDTILLGGTNDEGNWDEDPKTEVAERIVAECSRHRTSAARGGDPRPPRRPAAVPARGAAGIRAARRRRAVAQLRPRRRRHLPVLGLRRRDHHGHLRLAAIEPFGQASSGIIHHDDCVTGPRDTLLGMKFAIAIPQFYADGKFNPAGFRAYFARAEELGFDSAWTQEAVLGPGPQLSPIEAMTYAAACTERMRLGCVVFVSTLHSPVHLAKSVSTLDQLSRGRIEVGVGTGGKGRPFAAFGVDPGRYVSRFTEGIALMKALWTEPRVTFHGEFWQLENAPMEPKPFQKPYPRLWFGGASEPALRRAVRLGDGFFGAGSSSTAKFAEQVQIVRTALAEAGRPAEDFPIAKRVYIEIDENAERARSRMNAALERIYGTRVPAIEAAAITGPAADCVREVNQVAAAGAELILFTALFNQREQMEQLATAVLPKLG